jgi:hypothetical protein
LGFGSVGFFKNIDHCIGFITVAIIDKKCYNIYFAFKLSKLKNSKKFPRISHSELSYENQSNFTNNITTRNFQLFKLNWILRNEISRDFRQFYLFGAFSGFESFLLERNSNIVNCILISTLMINFWIYQKSIIRKRWI